MDKNDKWDKIMLGVIVTASISVIVFLVVLASEYFKIAYYQPIYNAELAGAIIFGGLLVITAFLISKLIIYTVSAEIKNNQYKKRRHLQ